jgi:hypothetical protein
LRAEALGTLRDGRKSLNLGVVVLVEVSSTVILRGLEIVILVAPRCASYAAPGVSPKAVVVAFLL